MMFLLYNLIFPFLFLLYLPFYLVHIFRRGGLTVDYWERIGIFTEEKKKRLRALENPVWIHAVSVGETVAAVSLVKTILARNPNEKIVFSCGTSTGFATAKAKMPEGVVPIYCPIDLWWAVIHVLNLVRPKALAIFEVEIWPNLIRFAAKKGVKTYLVNGRISDHSSSGYARWKWFFKPIFTAFTDICVQTPEDATRIARIIGDDPRIHVCGTMKFDQIPDCRAADKADVLNACFGNGAGRVILTGGSTHPGEEKLLVDAYKAARLRYPQLRLVLVPRHQERANDVVTLLSQEGLTWRLAKDENGATAQNASTADVFLVNTTGELMNYYGMSDICYVGKSLAGQTGGHNIIEPAIFGKAILYGHHMENFRAVAAIFQAEKSAVEVESDDALLPALENLLEHPEERMALGQRARQTVEKHRGAIDRTLNIMKL